MRLKNQANMTGQNHNNILQTNPRHREEKTQNTNSHPATGRQLKKSNQLSLPRRYDCKKGYCYDCNGCRCLYVICKTSPRASI